MQLETHTDIAVVVTDVRIADRDGLELANRILRERTGPTAVAVVVVTGHGELRERNTTAAPIKLPILCKPLVMGDFMKALDAAICRARAARAAEAHQPAAASERPTDHSQAEPRI